MTTEVVEDNTEDQRGIREMKEVGRKALVTNRLPPCAVHTSYYSMHHILCYFSFSKSFSLPLYCRFDDVDVVLVS